MNKFRDLDQVRQDIKSAMPLNDFIEIVDGRQLEMVNDHLYKKKCDLDEHPRDKDGSKDSTPSFTVCPQKELWWCFGCNSGGDRFEYLSRKLHIDHMESIFKAAEVVGLDLTPYYEQQTPEDMMRDSLFKENNMAREIAHNKLLSDERALQYLLGRGISLESIGEYQLGYAPPLDGDRVTIFDTVPNSISLQLDRKDQFNDAILFPVCDPYNRMRYFQSRPFAPMTGMKYIGGNDTHPLFDQEDRIFGLAVAKKKLRTFGGKLLVVEGGPDTIVCNQHGIPTIASLGTAISQKLFDIFDRYKIVEVIIAFDGDKAGWNASIQAANKYLAFTTKTRLKILMMPEGDPDEFINKNGPDAMKKLIVDAPLAIEYLVDAEFKNIDPTTPTKKIEFMTAVEKYVAGCHDDITRKILMRYIASKIGFDIMEIEDYYLKRTATECVSLYVPDEEEILLAEAIRNPDFAIELATQFKTDDWYLIRHQHLFDMIKDGKLADIDSIYQTAKNRQLTGIVTFDWLQKLQYRTGNLDFCSSDVEDKLVRRRTKEMIQKLDTEIMNMDLEPGVIVDRWMSRMYNSIMRRSETNVFDTTDQVNDVMKLIHQRMQNPGQIIGYSLGPNFERLTKALLGIQTKTLTVVSANQSVGKTQICENWAMYQAVEEHIPTLWFTLEMDKDRMTFRNLSILTGVPLTPLLTGNISTDTMVNTVDPMAVRLKDAPFYLSEGGHDIWEALSIARRYVISKGIKVIYVDYIQLQSVSGVFGKKRYEELGMISKLWKQFAKDMDVAVVAISQLSKEALKEDIAKAEHGAGSYEIAQDADNYLTLKEKDEKEIMENGLEHGNIVGNLDKNRMGVADILVNIYSERECQRMKECA